MNDVNLVNEIKAIKTLCGTLDQPRALLVELGISEEHFDDIRTKDTFKLIQAMSKSMKQIPTWYALSSMPNLSSDARELISGNDDVHPAAKNVGDAELFFNELDRMRKARICSAASKELQAALEPMDANPDDATIIFEKAVLALRNVRTDTTIRIGKDSNVMEHVDRALARTKPNVVPTGFRDFDEAAGGLPRGGLTTLASSSGGGKSCMAQQLAINASNAGYSAAIVSLEMSAEQTINRLMSNLSETNHEVFHLAKVNTMQKKRARDIMDKFNAKNDAAGSQLDIYHTPDMTFSAIALMLRTFEYDLIVVDYINLLSRGDTDEQNDAAQLGEIARQAKVQAGQTNTAWVVCAQLNEQGAVKYSKAIKENSDNMWSWTYGDAERESHVIDIEQQKSRSSKGFKFSLKELFHHQKFENAGESHENRDLRGVRKAKKHHTSRPMLPGFEEDDDDE